MKRVYFHFCRRARLQEQHGCSSCLWLCCRSNKGPLTQPSQQALRLQPIGIQLSVHFKGMLASLRASVHSFKSPAVGPERQTSHVFHPWGKNDVANPRAESSKNIRPHCPIILFYAQIRGGGQSAVGQSHFLSTTKRDCRGGGPALPSRPLADWTPHVLVPLTCDVSECVQLPRCWYPLFCSRC